MALAISGLPGGAVMVVMETRTWVHDRYPINTPTEKIMFARPCMALDHSEWLKRNGSVQ